jgi:hypothetical protein
MGDDWAQLSVTRTSKHLQERCLLRAARYDAEEAFAAKHIARPDWPDSTSLTASLGHPASRVMDDAFPIKKVLLQR